MIIKYSLLLSMFFVSTLVSARVFKDTIHSIDLGNNGEEHIIKFDNGQAAFISSEELKYKNDILSNPGQFVEVETDERNTVISIQPLPQEEAPKEKLPTEEMNSSKEMVPTVIPNWNQALAIWNGMNRSYKSETECTDRAHVWAYEEYKKNNLYSKKSFLFFTNTYIRTYRFNWWFHVSPYALVHEYGKDVEHIFDRKYASIPRHLREWTNIFIRSRRECPVTTYSNYRKNRNGTEHCYVVKADMYYRLPLHVRNLEDYRITKNKFNSSEVNFSYRAFKVRQVQ